MHYRVSVAEVDSFAHLLENKACFIQINTGVIAFISVIYYLLVVICSLLLILDTYNLIILLAIFNII